MKEKLIEWFVQRLAARFVIKGLTIAAAFVIAHGWLTPDHKNEWITSNSEVVIGLLITISSFVASWLQDKLNKLHLSNLTSLYQQHISSAVETALATDKPQTLDDLKAQAKAIIEAKTPNGL